MSAAAAQEGLIAGLCDARARTLALIGDLHGTQLFGPRLPIVNPPLWELGHVAWFHEYWESRHLHGLPPLRDDGDYLYDSAQVAHDRRWDLPLPSLAATQRYAETILARVVDRLSGHAPSAEATYFHLLGMLHEDMHGEAFAYTRQTLGYTAPPLAALDPPPLGAPLSGDASVPGGTFALGAMPDAPFVFDNEKWAHEVTIEPFHIARTAVTNAQLAAWVDDGGYTQRALWSEPGWRWREGAGASHPIYWRRAGRQWEERVYDRWIPLRLDHPAVHVCWYEADAYCRWAGRRLPSEAEWEAAAACEAATDGRLATRKRLHPWGDRAPAAEHANLDGRHGATVSVQAFPAGDSAFGCRQMCGNVWEWTADDFRPYPGFVVDPYKEYSTPWFGNHKVLRGGCWVTRSRLIRNTWRNFYTPDRRDVFAGFRTCAE